MFKRMRFMQWAALPTAIALALGQAAPAAAMEAFSATAPAPLGTAAGAAITMAQLDQTAPIQALVDQLGALRRNPPGEPRLITIDRSLFSSHGDPLFAGRALQLLSEARGEGLLRLAWVDSGAASEAEAAERIAQLNDAILAAVVPGGTDLDDVPETWISAEWFDAIETGAPAAAAPPETAAPVEAPEAETPAGDSAVLTGTIPAGDLAFEIAMGTAGWRTTAPGGFTIQNARRAAQSIANTGVKRVIIGYDSRVYGPEFARAVAEVLAANGVFVAISTADTPTPVMYDMTSPELGDQAYDLAIHFTASHNNLTDEKDSAIGQSWQVSEQHEFRGMKMGVNGLPVTDAAAKRFLADANAWADEAKTQRALTAYNRIPFEQIPSDLIDTTVDPVGHSINRLKEAINWDRFVANAKRYAEKHPDFEIELDVMFGSTGPLNQRLFEELQNAGVPARMQREGSMREILGDRPVVEGDHPLAVRDREGKLLVYGPNPTVPAFIAERAKAWRPGMVVLFFDGDGDRLIMWGPDGRYDADGKLLGPKELTPNEIGLVAGHYLNKVKGETGIIARTLPSSHMLDYLARMLGLALKQVPVGSKWFEPYARADSEEQLLVAVEESGHIFFKLNGKIFADNAQALAVLMLDQLFETDQTSSEYLSAVNGELKESGAPNLIYERGKVKEAAIAAGGLTQSQFADQALLLRRDNPEPFARYLAVRMGKPLRLNAAWEVVEGESDDVDSFDSLTDSRGIKVYFADGTWAMYRVSGTDGSIRIYTETNDEVERDRMQRAVSDVLVQRAKELPEQLRKSFELAAYQAAVNDIGGDSSELISRARQALYDGQSRYWGQIRTDFVQLEARMDVQDARILTWSPLGEGRVRVRVAVDVLATRLRPAETKEFEWEIQIPLDPQISRQSILDNIRAASGKFAVISREWGGEIKRQLKALINEGRWADAQRLAAENAAQGKSRLGWAQVVDRLLANPDRIAAVEAEARELADLDHVIFAGMGGSSLSVDLVDTTWPHNGRGPQIHTMNTVDPSSLRALQRQLTGKQEGEADPTAEELRAVLQRTKLVAISKSGGTAETLSHVEWMTELYQAVGLDPSEYILLYSDPGSKFDVVGEKAVLPAALAGKVRVRTIQRGGGTDIGGRFTSPGTSVFLLPFALRAQSHGFDVTAALKQAKTALDQDARNPNGYTALGQFLYAEAAINGRDKLTLLAPPALSQLGAWMEQLFEESLGKDGKGLTVFPDERLSLEDLKPAEQTDRVFLHVRVAGQADPHAAIAAQLKEQGYSVREIELADAEALAALTLGLEYTVATIANEWDIFFTDQDAVEGYKQATRDVLAAAGDSDPLETRLDGATTVVRDSATGVTLVLDGLLNVLSADAADFVKRRIEEGAGAAEIYGLVLDILREESSGIERFDLVKFGEIEAVRPALNETRSWLTRLTRWSGKVSAAPQKLHSYEQNDEDGKNSGFYTIMLSKTNAGPVLVPFKNHDQLLKAQALGTLDSLVANRRHAILLVTEESGEAGAAAIQRFFADAQAAMGGLSGEARVSPAESTFGADPESAPGEGLADVAQESAASRFVITAGSEEQAVDRVEADTQVLRINEDAAPGTAAAAFADAVAMMNGKPPQSEAGLRDDVLLVPDIDLLDDPLSAMADRVRAAVAALESA